MAEEALPVAHQIYGQDRIKELVRLAVRRNFPVLLVGETGVGKTSIVKSLADETHQKYIRFNLTGETTVDDFVGKYALRAGETVWEDGILLQAMREGSWLIVDEINVALPEILFVLHSLLDDERAVLVATHLGEVVMPHPNFRFFATMNPVDEYAGTKDLNKAFKSRFPVALNMDYPEPVIEVRILKEKTGLSEESANLLVDTAIRLRQLKQEGKLFFTCSTRELLQWAALAQDLSVEEAFAVALIAKAGAEGPVILAAFKEVGGKYESGKKAGVVFRVDYYLKEFQALHEARVLMETDKATFRKHILNDMAKEGLVAIKEQAKKIRRLKKELDQSA